MKFNLTQKISTNTYYSLIIKQNEKGYSLYEILKEEIRQDSLKDLIELLEDHINRYKLNEIKITVMNSGLLNNLKYIFHITHYGIYHGIDTNRYGKNFLLGVNT